MSLSDGEQIIGIVISVIGVVWLFHRQAMSKFDALITSVNAMTIQQALHSEKLGVGEKEFEKIADHQKEQDQRIDNIDKRIGILENKSS